MNVIKLAFTLETCSMSVRRSLSVMRIRSLGMCEWTQSFSSTGHVWIEQFRFWRAIRKFLMFISVSRVWRWPMPIASAPLLMKVLEL